MSFKYSREKEIEKLHDFLDEALDRVQTEEDPFELNDLRTIFKKRVPIFRRMYVAAYMLKKLTNVSLLEDDAPRTKRSKDKKEKKSSQQNYKQEIDESLYETLFVSVGRKRRVYPKDIVGLLMQNANLEKVQIGLIRVHDKYSFVQVTKDDAEKVISLLDGIDYRGRKLRVSYSRKKDDEHDQN